MAKRGRDLPCGNGDGEVPWRDDAHHAHGFAGDFHTHAGAHRWQHLARKAQGLACEEIEDLRGAEGLADPFGQRFPLLSRQQAAQFILARQNLVRSRAQDAVPLCRARARPCRERRLCRRNRGFGLGGAGAGVMADDVARVRGVDIGRALSGDPVPGDQVRFHL
jgi:hypothetical protein